MTMLQGPELSVGAEETFASELAEHLAPLRAALSAMLAEWGSPKTASALNTLSGAGQKICWQVFRIVYADDMVAEARNTPTPLSLKRLLAAAVDAGVAARTVRAVQDAADAFQAFSKQSAGDRASFDSLLAGVTPDESEEKILMSQRRAAYRSMSHIWGIQNDLLCYSVMVRRSASGTTTHSAMFMAQRGIRRLRPESQVTLFAYHPNPSATPGVTRGEDAIDVEASKRYGMPVLPQFSTSPLPEIEKVVEPGGMVIYNTVGRDIGPRGTLDCTFGRMGRDQPFMTDTDGRQLYHQTFTHIRKPLGLLVQEVLVHRPSFPNVRPELMVYQFPLGNVTQEAARRALPFPVDERLAMIGRADRAGLADVPRYGEMLRLGATAAGWDLSEFDVYRVRMPYPIMFSAVRIFFYVD